METSQQEQPQVPGKSQTERPSFDEVIVAKMRTCFQGIFADHPEVATIAATISWRGGLNEARVLHGLWLGENGIVVRPDEIFGSIEQCMKMLVQQVSRAGELTEHLRETVEVLGTEATKKHEELKEVEARVEARQRELAALSTDRG